MGGGLLSVTDGDTSMSDAEFESRLFIWYLLLSNIANTIPGLPIEVSISRSLLKNMSNDEERNHWLPPMAVIRRLLVGVHL